MLALFAVDQATCFPRGRRAARWPLSCVRVRELDGHGNVHERYKIRSARLHAVEDVAPGPSLVHQTGLHRWRPVSRTEPQRPVRPDEIVVAPQELDVPAELVCAPSVAGRATAQVRRALANREVEALDERGVQGCGILRRPERVVQPTRRADLHAPLDPHDTIVPPSLEHLTIDARRPKQRTITPSCTRSHRWRSGEIPRAPPEDDVIDHGLGV